MDAHKQGADALFILLGAIMVLAMHAGFAFLELGTVRKKNQVNALVKILVDFCVSTVAYFAIGYGVAYGTGFWVDAQTLADKNGYELVKFFFLLTFAAAIPAIISGGIAERARFWPQLLATAVVVGFVYPFFEGIAWNQHLGFQAWVKAMTGEEFHDFAGSVVVHAVGGWIALPAVLLLGARSNRYRKDGAVSAHPPSSIPFLALGAWVLIVGFIYPFFEGIAWNQHFGVQAWIKALTGEEFHDFAGSVVVHAVGGWIALPAVLLLGARYNRYRKDGAMSAHPPSNKGYTRPTITAVATS